MWSTGPCTGTGACGSGRPRSSRSRPRSRAGWWPALHLFLRKGRVSARPGRVGVITKRSRMSADWRRGLWRLAMAVFLTPIVLFVLYLVVVMTWSFSDGERVGYLQKFSHKGWLCKTYEGELAMTTE